MPLEFSKTARDLVPIFLCELRIPLAIQVQTGDSGTNQSPLLIPLEGLVWIIPHKIDLILVLYVQVHL